MNRHVPLAPTRRPACASTSYLPPCWSSSQWESRLPPHRLANLHFYNPEAVWLLRHPLLTSADYRGLRLDRHHLDPRLLGLAFLPRLDANWSARPVRPAALIIEVAEARSFR